MFREDGYKLSIVEAPCCAYVVLLKRMAHVLFYLI